MENFTVLSALDAIRWLSLISLSAYGLLLATLYFRLYRTIKLSELVESKERILEAKINALISGAILIEEESEALESVLDTLCDVYPGANRMEFSYLCATAYHRIRRGEDWNENVIGREVRLSPVVRTRLRRSNQQERINRMVEEPRG